MQENQKHPEIAPGLTWRLLDGEAVIVSPVTGKIRVLNAVGAKIWELLADGASVDAIQTALITQYQITSQEAQADVTAFLQELTERQLIIWQTGKMEF